MGKKFELGPSVRLNVGGRCFQATRKLLCGDAEAMFVPLLSGNFGVDRDDDGSIFIDRDGDRFRHVLAFLRDGRRAVVPGRAVIVRDGGR